MKRFISDLHIYDTQIALLRGYSSCEEMHEEMIREWNEQVGEFDHIYIIGDVPIYGNLDEDVEKTLKVLEIINKLNGIKHLVLGNHDYGWKDKRLKNKLYTTFVEIVNEMTVTINQYTKLFLSHYPHMEWRGQFGNTLHLFGHVHITHQKYLIDFINFINKDALKIGNVSVDVIGNVPLPYYEGLKKSNEFYMNLKEELKNEIL